LPVVVVQCLNALTLLVGWQEGHPACKKTEWWGVGVVICLVRGADLHMAQLMPLPLIHCLASVKSRLVLPFWYRLTRVVPDKGPLNGCVCVVLVQFHVVAELDVQPFGVSVCESTDRVMVTCSTPLRHVVPFVTKSSRLLVYHAASGAAERLIPLDDAYEIPRHSLAVGHCFAVCHGWHKHGKVASTVERERELDFMPLPSQNPRLGGSKHS